MAGGTTPMCEKNETLAFFGKTLSATLSGLGPNTTYELQVEAQNTAGSVRSEWVRTATLAANLPAPTLTVLGTNGIQIVWPAVPSVYGSLLFFTLVRDGALSIFNGTARSFDDTRLVPGKTYLYSYAATTTLGTTPLVKSVLHIAKCAFYFL
jgi:hypothetical protein